MSQFNIQSMTGFGRAQGESSLGVFSVELRSVNNRFQDISVALPPDLGALEGQLRALLKQEVARGKIDCRVRFSRAEAQPGRARINAALARDYIVQLRALTEAGASAEIPIQVLTSLPGVLEIRPPEPDEQEALWEGLREVAMKAIGQLNQERAREGQALGEQLGALAAELRGLAARIEAGKGEAVARFRERLTARAAELAADIKSQLDPGRLEMEVALFADRSDIDEELVRLRAHMDRLHALIENKTGEPAGKNLDFLIQELGREVNTIGSKARENAIAGAALEMKSILERVHEQAQNIQ